MTASIIMGTFCFMLGMVFMLHSLGLYVEREKSCKYEVHAYRVDGNELIEESRPMHPFIVKGEYQITLIKRCEK